MLTRCGFLKALLLCAFAAVAGPDPVRAQSADELDAAADAAIETLKASEPVTERMISKAKGILIFPEIIKGGFIVGAAGGKGVLRVNGKTQGYYQSVAASFGLQAGVSKYGYIMFLMDDAALEFVKETQGWEVGVGPNITIADKGIARKLSTSSVQEGIYVFFVDQKGFFAGSGLEGSKISPIGQ